MMLQGKLSHGTTYRRDDAQEKYKRMRAYRSVKDGENFHGDRSRLGYIKLMVACYRQLGQIVELILTLEPPQMIIERSWRNLPVRTVLDAFMYILISPP